MRTWHWWFQWILLPPGNVGTQTESYSRKDAERVSNQNHVFTTYPLKVLTNKRGANKISHLEHPKGINK
jgi:hypothetical protein